MPGSQPRYNTAFDLAHLYLDERRHDESLLQLEANRLARDKQALLDWLDGQRRDADTPYVLMRGRHYDLFAAELAGRATAVLRDGS